MANEQDLRLGMLNTLLTTPHRQLDKLWPVHEEMVQKDPRFYVRLAAWYADHGDVRVVFRRPISISRVWG